MTKPKYAFSVQVEDHYGIIQVVARICTVTEDGELRNISGGFDRDPYGDFTVDCYVDDKPDGGVWGVRYHYRGVDVDNAAHAQAMGRLLTKVDKGLARLSSARGYVDGFGDTLLRIAEVLRIGEIHVRNGAKRRDVSGRAWSVVDGSGLLSWVGGIHRTARADDQSVRREYINR